ncbi:hypothetical protein [Micromonospora sp. NPDC047074]|uniref:hypothetical protein n=1 Tax=Micromonospora sp. NPDC047074 TaxID=3154339 RepID=UPI0033FD4AA5
MLTEQFGLLDRAELLEVATAEGPGALIDRVRVAEREHPDRLRRHEAADDASVLLCEFDPARDVDLGTKWPLGGPFPTKIYCRRGGQGPGSRGLAALRGPCRG